MIIIGLSISLNHWQLVNQCSTKPSPTFGFHYVKASSLFIVSEKSKLCVSCCQQYLIYSYLDLLKPPYINRLNKFQITQDKVTESVHKQKLQTRELLALGLLSASSKLSGLPDYRVPDWRNSSLKITPNMQLRTPFLLFANYHCLSINNKLVKQNRI